MISSCLAQLRGRLGVARVIISELKADGKDVEATSQLQAAACEEILAKGFKELDTAQKADLAELAHKAGFQDAHLQLILQRLVKSKAGAGRRESQDFTSFLHYGSANDWDSIESRTEEEIDDRLCQILVRLNCVNPCEQTKKVLASAALVAFYKKAVIPEAVKSAKFVSIKSKFDKTRRFIKKQETKTGVHTHYLLRLPKNPSELLALSPELHARAYLSGFASPRLDKTAMSLVSAAFSCRGHEKRVGVATTAADAKDASSKADMMQAMLMMQTMILQGGMQGRQDSEDDLGCNITIEKPGGNQKKRCIQAMFGNHSSGRPSLRRASTINDDTTASRAGSVEAPRTPSRNPQTALELQTPSMTPQIAAAPLMDLADADRPPPPSPTPLALPPPPAVPPPLAPALPAPHAQTTLQIPIAPPLIAPQTQPVEQAEVADVYTPQGHAKHSSDMFDAFVARSTEKADVKKKEGAEKRQAEKQAKALAAKEASQAAKYQALAMKVASRQVITDKEIAALQLAKEPEPAKELPLALVAKDVLKNPGKKPAKKPAKIKDASARVASGSPKSPVTVPKKVKVDHERSREQFLVRVPGMKSEAFIYKKTHSKAYDSLQQAKDAAEAFYQSKAT